MRPARPRSLRILSLTGLVAALLLVPRVAAAQEPVVSVWYRGTPAGTPQQSELAAIRALGFQAVTWPSTFTAGFAELNRLAPIAGLKVLVADPSVARWDKRPFKLSERVDIVINRSNASIVTPLAWYAVAHGARSIAFDSGSPTGAGLEERDRSLKSWARAALSFARQFSANSNLVSLMQPGPELRFGHADPAAIPTARDLVTFCDVKLLDAGRAWVIIATNTLNVRSSLSVYLPKSVPYALWVSWIGGPPLAMVSEPAGPRWVLTMAPRTAQVYIIDKTMK